MDEHGPDNPVDDTIEYQAEPSGFEPTIAGPADASDDRTSLPDARTNVINVDDFVRSLDEIGLVTGAEIRTFLQRFTETDVSRDGRRLGRELVAAGLLTAYQAGAICQGKAKGLVIGRYLVEEKLGVGGMGMVFKARHRRMNRVVALKILPPSVTRNPDSVQRFHREAEMAAKLDHPNIVRAIDADEAGGMHFLVMEFVDGTNLSKLVKSRGPQSMAKTVDLIIQAARGLEAAHFGGIIHRDIKPSNLMLDGSGVIKVLDLGLARLDDDSSPDGQPLTLSGAIMGTVDYMSPEQAYDPRLVDARSDIYSLGCTLHYLLTAQPLYAGTSLMQRLLAHREHPVPSLRSRRPDASRSLDELFAQLVAKDPNHRPRSMTELIACLEACRPSAGSSAASSRPLIMFDNRKPAASTQPSLPHKSSVDIDPTPLPRLVAMLPAAGSTGVDASGSGYRIEDKKQRVFTIHGADAIGFRRWIDLMRSRDSIPTGISSFDGGDRPLFAAVAVPNRERVVWEVMLHSDTIELSKYKNTMESRGSTLALFGGYATSVRNGTVSLYRQTTDTIADSVDLDLSALNIRLAQIERSRHRLICLAGYPTETDRRFAVVSSHAQIRPQRWHVELTLETLKTTLDRARADGFLPISLASYPVGETPSFAIILEKSPDRPWDVSIGLTHDALVSELDRRLTRGFSPMILCGYRQSATVLYIGAWIQGRPLRRY